MLPYNFIEYKCKEIAAFWGIPVSAAVAVSSDVISFSLCFAKFIQHHRFYHRCSSGHTHSPLGGFTESYNELKLCWKVKV